MKMQPKKKKENRKNKKKREQESERERRKKTSELQTKNEICIMSGFYLCEVLLRVLMYASIHDCEYIG